MLKTIALLALIAIVNAEIFYKDYMETDPFSTKRWVHSDWKQDTGEAGKFEWSSGLWSGDSNHKGIRTPVDAKFYSATSKMSKTFDNTDQTLVLQFSVKHEQKIDCGGGYVKLLPPNTDQSKFNGESPYTIMFGPDICGYSTKKVHVIFNHNGQNLLKKEDVKCPDDEFTHFYTLIIRSDDTYEVLIDGESKEKGKLKEGWDFEKPKMIKDPNAKKPSDWVDKEYMDDTNDVKPADWDTEPEKIADPEAVKPDDWNEEEDGKWEAPTIPNPKYKGQWKPKQIKNPDYKGPWIHPEISNPDYVEHSNVYKRGSIGMVGIEIWQVKAGTLFGDFLLTNDENEAKSEYESRKIDKTKEEAAKKTYDDAHKPPEPETPPEMPEEHEEL
jgi:calreticulin